MRFAHPAHLAWLALILLLLLARRRQAQLPVSNLFLWSDNRAQEATPFARRFRRHRLLLLQAAFLAVLALSLAGPLAASRPRQVAVVVDVSMSMAALENGTSRLDLARSQVEALLGTLRGSTSVQLVSASTTPLAIGTFKAGSELRQAIAALRATDGTANLGAAVQAALAGAPSPEKVFVFTDSDAQAGLPDAVEWSSVATPAINFAVSGLTARATGNGSQLLATVSNYGDAPVEAALKLLINDVPAGDRRVTVPANGSVRASFFVAERDGIATVRLEHEDALAADNLRMVMLARSPRTRVRMSGPTAQSFFVAKALAANENIELVSDPGGANDVVVCVGCSELPQDGGGVLWFPPSQFDGSPALLVRAQSGHPLAANLALDGVVARLVRSAPPAAGSTVIARAGDQPAILAYEAAARVVEVRIDPAGEPFALSTAFPVLIANAIEWLAIPGQDTRAAVAGEPLRLVSNTAVESAQVTGPDGRSVRSTMRKGIVTVADTSTAGLYRFQGRTVTVNPAAGPESDLRAVPAPTAFDAGSSPTADPRPLDLTPALVAAALLLLGIEWHFRTA